MSDSKSLLNHIDHMQKMHDDLKGEINHLFYVHISSDLQAKELKKRKLHLKDMIAVEESRLH